MSISKSATILGLALTFAGAAPALAHNNLNDWMAMMQRIRQQQATMQPAVRAQVVNPTISGGNTVVSPRLTKRRVAR